MSKARVGDFAKNTIITFSVQILTMALALLSSIVIARSLGPEGKGIYSLAILLPMLLVTFANFGLGPASIFFIGKGKYSPREVFGADCLFSLVLSVFTIFIGLIIIFFFAERLFPNVNKIYLLLSLILIPVQIFSTIIINILLGLQDIKRYNLIQSLRFLLFLVFIAISLLIFNFRVKAAIFSLTLSFSIISIALFFMLKREIGMPNFKFKKNIFKDFWQYAIKCHLGNIMAFFLYKLDIFMINIFLNPLMVGLYSVSAGIAEKNWLISKSASLVLFPKVSSEKNEENLKKFTPLVCRNTLFISAVLAALLFFVSQPLIILLYQKDFSHSIMPLKVLLIGVISLSGGRILTNDLAGRGQPILNTYITGGAVILNIILNIWWIQKFGIIGAAWASTVSYTFLLIVAVIVYSRVSGNKFKDIFL